MSAAVWGWALILAVVLIVELALHRSRRPLLSDWVRSQPYLAAPILLFFGMLAGHWFWCSCVKGVIP